MNATMSQEKTNKPKLSRSRTSAPMLSNEAQLKLSEIGEEMGGISIPSLLSQLGEASKKGKAENWHRAVAAFQDAIER